MVILITEIIKKIDALREAHGWTEYELAERSGISQSTISTWYRKDIYPSIPSLKTICDTFGITLSQFFLEEDQDNLVSFNPVQKRLIKASTKYTPNELDPLVDFLETVKE